MKYIKLLEDVADEKHEYDIEEFELLGNMKYGVIDEGINFYKIKNQFNEIKKYDKDLFSLMLNSDEILVKEFDDFVKIINCYGFNFKVDKNENTDS